MARFTVFLAFLLITAPAFAADGVHTVFHLHWSECAFDEGAPTLRVTQGDPVTLHLHADSELELHLHGYDTAITVPAHGEVKHRFVADVAGRFPVAIHSACGSDGHEHRTAFYLEVLPG